MAILLWPIIATVAVIRDAYYNSHHVQGNPQPDTCDDITIISHQNAASLTHKGLYLIYQ